MKNEDYKYKFNTQNTAIIITNYIGKQKDVVIPNEIEDLPVTVIATVLVKESSYTSLEF